MSLEKATIAWGSKQLVGMIKNEKINFDHIVQRSYVWERSRKSAFIESLIVGYPIPPVFAKRTEDGNGKRSNNIYYIMDGKQRLNTIKEFLNDEFSLSNIPSVKYFDEEENTELEVDISGKKFSELPEAIQGILNTAMINVVYFDNLTSEEEKELFKRLNAGKPLSAKSKLLASCRDIHNLLDIGGHELFSKMITEKGRNNKYQAIIVMKVWCMMNKDINDVHFDTKSFNSLLENTTISDVEKLAINEVFNYIVNMHNVLIDRNEKKVAKKLYTETHMVSLVPYVKKAIEDGIKEEIMVDWIIEFFGVDETSISELYNNASDSGSAKSNNIILRNEELNKSFVEFFGNEEGDN